MEPRKLTKEDLDKVRDIEGFPIGTDEDIIALSDPPYYTACPNPFIADFIKEHGTPYDEATDDYHCEPFTADVSEGKNDPFYMAHSYHTKVPYRAIMKYILHYTKPNDIVFDGFCGTGMTGVASQMCSEKDLDIDRVFSKVKCHWGKRKVILNDLSPIAAFISANYNKHVDIESFYDKANNILLNARKLFDWIYQTNCEGNLFNLDNNGHINYVVWSQVVMCPHCGKELVLYDMVWDSQNKKVIEKIVCPDCGSTLTKDNCDKYIETEVDNFSGETREKIKSVPVLINYTFNKKRYEKRLDEHDYDLLKKINLTKFDALVPHDLILKKGKMWGDTWRAGVHFGITNINHFYTKRSLIVLSFLYNECKKDNRLLFWFTSCLPKLNIMNRYMPQHGSRALVGPMSGTLYVAPIYVENNVLDTFEFQLKKMLKVNSPKGDYCITNQSLTDLTNFPDDSIDYIFTDPPFGGNLMYSELSFIWEAWLRIYTNSINEAIVSPAQNKGDIEYTKLMYMCFKEYYRVLKPKRWITVEFHNSKNAVWYAIQQALFSSGFIIADVRVLDKQKGTIKQLINTTSVKQDLVISAYKPQNGLNKMLMEQAGKPETAWAFVQQHLENLPVVVDADNNGKIDILPERQAYLLFDRMVAYHIMQGITGCNRLLQWFG